MESYAALIAGIFIASITIAVLHVITAILYRRGKAKLWIAATVNAVNGFIAMWAISTSVLPLAVAPLASLVIASILITMPRKNRAE